LRILADENVHPVVVQRLRDAGYDTEWIAETAAGIADFQILDRIDIAEFVLITYDRDFGDLIFNQKSPKPLAVIYSRLGRAEPRYIADRIVNMLDSGMSANQIHVIKKDGIRSTPFPDGI
jgi:predicted nuclease of predicted toxin-antitoxin system